jgi:hypothetical protein
MADRQNIPERKAEQRSRRRAGVLAAFIPLVLAGCAGQPVQLGATVKSVPREQALVMPPPAGPAIVSVIERRYDNAVEQDIHLATSAMTPGQNMLRIQLFGTTSPFRMSSNALTSTPLTQSGVGSEMRKALPGIRMARSNFYVQNSYGPFGYAFGRGLGSDLCIYGWQQVRSPSGTMSPFANYGSIQIRLRVCDAGATEQKLLAIMYNYTIVGAVDAGGWNPYGEPSQVPSTLGGSGAPTYPRPASVEPMVPAVPQRQSIMFTGSTRVASAPRTQRAAVRAATTVKVAPEAPPIPAPQSTSVSQIPSPGPQAVASAQGANTPLVPSPGVAPAPAPSLVTVPSPSCTPEREGTDVVCR